MSLNNKRKIKYVMEKLIQMIVVLIILSVAVFVLSRLCPGDPLKSYYGDGVERMSEAQRQLARENLGLNDSMVTQYTRWVKNLFQGDLGISFKYKQPVSQVIGDVWQNTLLLGGVSYLLIFGLSVAIGMFCAMNEEKLVDKIVCKIGTVTACIPTFFMAMILIYIFAVNLQILPTSGAYSYGNKDDLWDRMVHLVLPVTVLVLEHLWYYAYMIRNKLIEEKRQDYVMLCKAEGIPKWKILCRHCMKNSTPSLIVIMAIALPHILGGTYVAETIFGYPGIGTLSFESAMYKDYNMLMALCLLTGAIVLVLNIGAQIINEFIDPRMKYEETEEIS